MSNDNYRPNRSGNNRNGDRTGRPNAQGGGRPFNRTGNGNQNRRYDNGPTRDKASAPYNFVPLPTAVLPAPFVEAAGTTPEEKYVSYIRDNGRLSGFIELAVESKTPFYIGGGEGDKFFAPTDGVPLIPGSTMRGMVKNIMKVLTCGAMRPSGRKEVDSEEIEGDGDFFDRKLYFRTMAAKAGIGIKAVYDAEMVQKGADGRGKSKAQAGFLVRIGRKYFVCPAAFKEVKDAGLVGRASIKNTPAAAENKHCIQWDARDGICCFTGEMRNKKRYTIHKKPSDWTRLLDVPDDRIIAYQDDATRRGIDLFKVGKRNEEAVHFTRREDVSFVVPCFYVADGNTVRHFGFGRYYRVPYKYGIANHIPKSLWENVPPDFADAIFGQKEKWGSRLAFEDCVCEKSTLRTLDSFKSRILATPNPTSFQLYLEQKNNTAKRNHWNSMDDDNKPVAIRGYKFYWHQKNSEEGWKRRPTDPDMKGTTPIAPVAAGTKFHGKIRFERLSEIELGALLSVFSLAEKDKSICFKLGRGKSIGMGSVRIDAKLKLIDKSAYTQLFEGDTWSLGEKDAEIGPYVNKFNAYLEKTLKAKGGQEAFTRYEKLKRALSQMLNWQTTNLPNWVKETEMMTIGGRNNPFTERIILPDVEDVINRAKTQGKP